jgi:small conductance mechanosensitive channel
VVKEIEIFTSKLMGLSNKEIIIPSDTLFNGTILNYTRASTKPVTLVIGVSYDTDIKKTKEILVNLLTSHLNC